MTVKEDKYTLLMFGQGPFSPDYRTRSGQLVKFFLRDHRIKNIIYVEPYFTSCRVRSWGRHIVQNILKGSFFLASRRVEGVPQIRVWNILNLKRVKSWAPLFARVLTKQLKAELGDDAANLIVWVYNPAEQDVFDMFPGAIKVFDTIDNWAEMKFDAKRYPWYNRQAMVDGYAQLCRRRGVTIISNGQEMTKYYLGLGAQQAQVTEETNGVDCDLFSADRYQAEPVPADLSGIKRPIIGYIGLLQERFDVPMYKRLVADNPDCSFVIIGKLLPFRNFVFDVQAPNFFFIGPKPYSDVPKYLSRFDVCIVPHRTEGLASYMSPLKIYEYLAMGKPVITTNVGGLEAVRQYCYVVDTQDQFNAALKAAVSEAPGREKTFPVENFSWEMKVRRILDVVLSKRE